MGRGGIIVGRYCHPSSVVEQCFRKAQVVGSSPMGGFHYATGGALRAAPVAAFQPPSASPLATRAHSADWIGRMSWSSRFVPPRPGRVGSRVESHGWLCLRNRRCPSGSACCCVSATQRVAGGDARSFGRLDRPNELVLALGASAAWPRRQSRRVPWVAFTAFTKASSLRDIGLGGGWCVGPVWQALARLYPGVACLVVVATT